MTAAKPATPRPAGRSGRTRAWFLLLLAAATGLGLLLASQPAHPLADVSHYKYWARLVATEGIAASYSGQYPESYAIYPPVTLYALGLVGQLYQRRFDPTFEVQTALASQALTFGVRLVALSLHLVLGAVIYGLLERPAGGRAALLAAGLYLFNPGALWDVAIWAQPDSWYALFALLALWWIGGQQPALGGGALVLALATKPQAWLLAPLATVALLRSSGWRSAWQAILTGGGVLLLVIWPYLAAGRLAELTTLPAHISSVMPAASANAHNLWWLVTRGTVPFVVDSEPLPGLGSLTYRQAALLLVLGTTLFVLVLAWRAQGRWELLGLGAFSAHAWFCFTAGAHENHPFLVIPLLAMVAWRSPFLMALFLALSATFSFNVLVHDFGLAPLIEPALGRWNWRLQQAASLLNLAILGVWSVWFVWRRFAAGPWLASPGRVEGAPSRGVQGDR